MRHSFGRRFFSVIFCLTLVLYGVISVFAAGCEFCLTDAQVKKGRLFTASLECKADKEICAFIAEIEYDEDAVEYKSASVIDNEAQCSVNATESGHLRLVYLCEEGAGCKSKSPLIELKFKALKSGEHSLLLSVMQVIDRDSSDVQVNIAEGALVQVDALTESHSSSGRKESVKADKAEATSGAEDIESASSEDKHEDLTFYTSVDGTDYDVILIVASVMAVLVLLCLVGFCAYKFGAKAAIKKKEHVPLDEDSDDMGNE